METLEGPVADPVEPRKWQLCLVFVFLVIVVHLFDSSFDFWSRQYDFGVT